ncbi:MAG: hypothetical protein ACOC9Y_09380 [Chloroflexota bacterium]
MRQRIRAYAITLILAGLVVSPLFGAFADDNFPISTYQMFAAVRPDEVSVPHAVIIDADGSERPVPPAIVANDEVLQSQATIRQALRRGDTATAALCNRIADRLGNSDAVAIEIVTSTYDAVLYYQGDQEPGERTLHARCEVQP